jgi:hypothetical protein
VHDFDSLHIQIYLRSNLLPLQSLHMCEHLDWPTIFILCYGHRFSISSDIFPLPDVHAHTFASHELMLVYLTCCMLSFYWSHRYMLHVVESILKFQYYSLKIISHLKIFTQFQFINLPIYGVNFYVILISKLTYKIHMDCKISI